MSKKHVCNKLDFDTLFEMRFVKKKKIYAEPAIE